MVQHDVGYTAPLVREGGFRGVMLSGKHKIFGTKIAYQQKDLWDVGKVFTRDEYSRAMKIILTHDSTSLSLVDPVAYATRVADNMALFQGEKLPGFFRYIDGGKALLVRLGAAAAKKDEVLFKQVRDLLYSKIDMANLSGQLKRDLKNGVREISMVTPKFTMGVLGGEVGEIISTATSVLSVELNFNKFDQLLQSMFDMGQAQAKKVLKDYGVTEFGKTNYMLGEFKGKSILEIVVKNAPVRELIEGTVEPFTAKQATKLLATRMAKSEAERTAEYLTISASAITKEAPVGFSPIKLAAAQRQGQCYKLAAQTALQNPGWDVAHGQLHLTTGPFAGKKYAYAWLEKGNLVYDPVFDKFYDKKKYYNMYLSSSVKKYSQAQLPTMLEETKTWGPWKGAAVEPLAAPPPDLAKYGGVNLTSAQKKAIDYASKISRPGGENAWFQSKVKARGHDPEVIAALVKRFKQELQIRVDRRMEPDSKSFHGVYKSGKLKNQFVVYTETGRKVSGGYVEPFKGGLRDLWEQVASGEAWMESKAYTTAGAGDALPLSEAVRRPNYGYVYDPALHEKFPTRYGNVSFVLKDTVKRRATFTVGNSSQLGEQSEKYFARRLARVLTQPAGPARAEAIRLLESQREYVVEVLSRNLANFDSIENTLVRMVDKYSPQELKAIVEDTSKPLANYTLRKFPGVSPNTLESDAANFYMEAQIYGEVKLFRDVKEIVVYGKPADFAHIAKLAKAYRLPLRFVE